MKRRAGGKDAFTPGRLREEGSNKKRKEIVREIGGTARKVSRGSPCPILDSIARQENSRGRGKRSFVGRPCYKKERQERSP